MILSFLLVGLITISGLSLTYLIDDGGPLMWRLAAGNVIGCAIYGTLTFVIACFFGLSIATSIVPLLLTLCLLGLLAKKERLAHLRLDWQRAKGKLQGANARKFLTFSYYAFFFIILWLFFERSMFELPDGIYTGGSHNLGDLPFHLGAIFSFTDGNNFPPQNPSFAAAKFSYPFIADVVTAGFMKLGADVREAMFAQNFSWGLSLLVLLDRFVLRLTSEKSAGKIAVFLLFFCGGLGFLLFFDDFKAQASGFWEFLWRLPRDYTMNDQGYSWGNSLITLFMTQRSLLLGMPLTLVVLTFLWNIFITEIGEVAGQIVNWRAMIVGLLAGCLPLIHLHSLAVLFVVGLFLLVIRPEQWHAWIYFGVGVCVVAVPEIAWSLIGSASKATEFIGWHLGWDMKDENVLWFWIRNTGALIPVIVGGIIVAYLAKKTPELRCNKARSEMNENYSNRNLLLFYLPFVFCFVIANVTKLAPWEWDNIKVLIYWFVGSLPLVAIAILWAWRQNVALKTVAGVCFTAMVAAGSLDVWRTVSGQIKTNVFDRESERVAEQIKKTTPANATFLNAPTYNSAVVLSGRQSLMRFSGHLWSHGIDYGSREEDVKRIYSGAPGADTLLRKYGVDYVLISPLETSSLKVNEDFFRKYPVVTSTSQSRVYKVR